MNKKLKAKWLKALRGGRYRQGRGALVNDTGSRFCCLGVLADIQGCEWKPSGCGPGMVPISPGGRKTWCRDSDDWLPSTRAGSLPGETQEELAQMNDDGASFDKIAAFIELKL